MEYKRILVLSLFLVVFGSGWYPQETQNDCSKALNANDRGLCYMKNAIEKNNAEECAFIVNPDLKESWLTWVDKYDSYDEWHTCYYETTINQ